MFTQLYFCTFFLFREEMLTQFSSQVLHRDGVHWLDQLPRDAHTPTHSDRAVATQHRLTTTGLLALGQGHPSDLHLARRHRGNTAIQ